MARFEMELPLDVIRQIQELSKNSGKMMEEMVTAAADVVIGGTEVNARKVFKNPDTVIGDPFQPAFRRKNGLKRSKVYRTKSRDSINVKIMFVGYVKGSKPTPKYPNGTPIPLIAAAREYGTSKGEAKRPFFRPAFNKSKIERTIQLVQDKYIKGD